MRNYAVAAIWFNCSLIRAKRYSPLQDCSVASMDSMKLTWVRSKLNYVNKTSQMHGRMSRWKEWNTCPKALTEPVGIIMFGSVMVSSEILAFDSELARLNSCDDSIILTVKKEQTPDQILNIRK